MKENRPKGLSLAAIIILACMAMGLISRPEVAEVSVSWYSRRSSGRSSSRAWGHDRYVQGFFYGMHTERHYYWSAVYQYRPYLYFSVNSAMNITQYLQNNAGSRLSVPHSHSARDCFKLRNHSWSYIPVHLDLSKHTWSSYKAGRRNDFHVRIFLSINGGSDI